MAEEYCEHCELPLSTCVHGMPPPPTPAEPAPKASRVRVSRVATTSSSTTTKAAPAAPRLPSRVTAQAAFRTHIVAILLTEGSLETEDMLLELEMAMAEELRERDRQPTPTGEIRWHTTARIERKAMIDEGLLAEGRAVWRLTEAGRATK